MVLSVPSRRLALAHSSHRCAETSVAARLLRRNSRTDLAVRALAVSARRCSLAPSSLRKLLHSPPLIVPKSPLYSERKTGKQKSRGRSEMGTLPQRDAATAILRSRGAISRVMSCAQFPPDNKLCFMAVSTLSILSEGTSAMNRALPPSSPGGSRVTFSLFSRRVQELSRFGSWTLHRIRITAQIY